MARKGKKAPEINASSMADIAFLLLVFFLMVTTIETDEGILHKLPPWVEEPQEIPPINQRNILEILVNAEDYLLVEGKYTHPDDLKSIAMKFLTNNGKDPASSDSPDKAVISLKNDRGTSYEVYIKIQNEIKSAYYEVRDVEAKKLTNGKFTYKELEDLATDKDLSKDDREKYKYLRNEVRKVYPMKISEAEPVNTGSN